jgi:hypothetical protein
LGSQVSVVVQNNQKLNTPSLTCGSNDSGRLQRSLERLGF